MAEQVALRLAAGDDRGRPPPVQKRAAAATRLPALRWRVSAALGDAAGVVVEADQRIELVRRKRHSHGARTARPRSARGRRGRPGTPRGSRRRDRRACREAMVGRIGRPGRGRVADAEGPDAGSHRDRARARSFVPDEGQQAPVGHVHGITGEARGSGSAPRRRGRRAADGRRPAGIVGVAAERAREAEKVSHRLPPSLARAVGRAASR